MTNSRSILLALLTCTACAITADQAAAPATDAPSTSPVAVQSAPPQFDAFCANLDTNIASLGNKAPTAFRAVHEADGSFIDDGDAERMKFKKELGTSSIIAWLTVSNNPILELENANGFVAQLSYWSNQKMFNLVAGSSGSYANFDVCIDDETDTATISSTHSLGSVQASVVEAWVGSWSTKYTIRLFQR